MSDALITSLTLEHLREIMQLAGYRVETMSDPVANAEYLRSATSGLAFDIRPGSRLDAKARDFVDMTLIAVLQVEGEFPLDLVNRWNVSRRFARLQLSPPFLILTHDVSVAGGVVHNHLRAQIEIWDQLLQQLIPYLRAELPKLAGSEPSNQPASEAERGLSPVAPAMVQ